MKLTKTIWNLGEKIQRCFKRKEKEKEINGGHRYGKKEGKND